MSRERQERVDDVLDDYMRESNAEEAQRAELRTPLYGLSDPQIRQMLDATCYTTGGEETLTEPLINLHSLPGADRRRVSVVIVKYLGGTHHWVRVEEQDDYYWDWDRSCWRRPHRGYDELKGRKFEGRFTRPEGVQPFIDRVLEHFPADRYEVDWQSYNTTVYGREGD